MSKITKLQALETIDAAGEVTSSEFAEALRRRGFAIAGSWHAHTILVRLKRQGLVSGSTGSTMLSYKLKGRDGEVRDVSRRQRTILWEITDRGAARRAYLASKPQGRSKKKAANPRKRKEE